MLARRAARFTPLVAFLALACSENATGPSLSRSLGDDDDTMALARRGSPFGLAVSHQDIVYVTLAHGRALARLDLPGRDFSAIIPVGEVPTAVAFDPTGATAYVTNQFSRSVGVVDVQRGAQVGEIPVTGDPFVLLVTPGGDRLYVTTNADRVYVVELPGGTVADSVVLEAEANGLALHPDRRRLYASVISGPVVEIDTHSLHVLRTFELGGKPQGIAVSRDGTRLYVANEAVDPRGGLEIWDLVAGTRIQRVAIGGLGFGLGLSPDERRIFVTRSLGGDVKIVSPENPALIRTLETGGMPRRIGFNAAGTVAVIANEAGWVDFVR